MGIVTGAITIVPSIPGDPGEDGRGISSVGEEYLRSKSATDYTQNDGDWSVTVPALNATYRYLWNREKIVYTDGTSSYTTPHVAGMWSADGKGIAEITNYYLATSAGSGVTTATTGWTTTVQFVTSIKKYLWNYETTTFTDGTESSTSPRIIGVYGDQGDPGEDGKDSFGVTLSPSTITFTADSGGNVSGTQWCDIVATCGTARATVAIGGVVSVSGLSSSSAVVKSGSGTTAARIGLVGSSVSYTEKTFNTVGTGGVVSSQKVKIPVTSGQAVVTVTLSYGGRTETRNVTVSFDVDVKTTFATFFATNDKFIAQVFSTDGINDRLGKVEVKADRVSLSVDSRYTVGRNMLPRAMVRQVVRANTYSGNNVVMLTAGKVYTLAARCRIGSELKVNNQRLVVFLYRNDSSGVWQDTHALEFSSETEWTMKSVTFEAEATSTYYVYASICNSVNQGEAAKGNGYGCVDWFHLEEGDVCTAPSAHEGDLDSQMDLASEWTYSAGEKVTVQRADGKDGVAYHGVHSEADGSLDIAAATGGVPVVEKATYTLSFWARGNGNIYSYLYPTACAGAMDEQGNMKSFTSSPDGGDGASSNTLTDTWKRYVVVFTTVDGLAAGKKDVIALRIMGVGEAWVYGMKIEKGGVPTDENVKNRLLATGVDVEAGTVTVTADNFYVQNNSGEKTAAVNSDGQLQVGSLIAGDKSGANVSLDFNEGIPRLIAKDNNGNIVWMFNGEVTYNGGKDYEIINAKCSGSVSASKNMAGTKWKVGYSATIVIKNTGSSPSIFTGQGILVQMRQSSVSSEQVTLDVVSNSGVIPVGGEDEITFGLNKTYVSEDGNPLPSNFIKPRETWTDGGYYEVAQPTLQSGTFNVRTDDFIIVQ